MRNENLVFISYAREDRAWAERLYMDLRKQDVNVWLDIRTLKAGASWKREVQKLIRSARYFILLISKHSVNKRGHVQKEIKEALDVLREFPAGEIFLIPVKLDDSVPADEELNELNWVALYTDYHDGLARILSSLVKLPPEPLVVAKAGEVPSLLRSTIDKGREVTLSTPLVLGKRAAIRYAPFRSAKEFLQQFVDRLPSEDLFADRALSYYFVVDTQHPDLLIGDDLRAEHPERMMVVLQNVFRDLQARERGFSVVLTFGHQERTVAIPYEAIREIRIPELGIFISIAPALAPQVEE
jgi:hypothetical protein